MSVPWYLMAKGKGGGYKTASGPIVSVSDALAAPLRSLLVNIEPVQDLHGYDNPWPAGGGKNRCSMADKTFVQFLEVEIDEIPAGTYIYSAVVTSSDTDETRCAIIFLDADKNTLSSKALNRSVGGSRISTEFTVSATIKYVRLYASNGYPSGAGDTATFADNMICLASATDPTVYAPYSNICPISGWSAVNVWVNPTYDPAANPTATIQLGDTYYGATLDVTNGVLTVDRAMVDLGTLDYGITNTNRFYNTTLLNGFLRATTTSERATGVLCSIYKPSVNLSYSPAQDNCSWLRGMTDSSFDIVFKDERYTNAEDFKAAMSGVQLVYTLATPITIPLTDITVETLAGQNVMWADCGNVTVEYLSAGGANPDLMKLAVAFMGRK